MTEALQTLAKVLRIPVLSSGELVILTAVGRIAHLESALLGAEIALTRDEDIDGAVKVILEAKNNRK